MQIQPETIIWNQPSSASKPVAAKDAFSFEKILDDRINGSVPVWRKAETPEEQITASMLETAKGQKTPELATALIEPEAEDKSFGFLDVIDMINPLQHIPVVSTFYRNLTGDTIGSAARVVGGAAFGGPIGAAAGIVNALVQMETGKDVADNMVASVKGSEGNDTTIGVANLQERIPVYNS
ncbi:MAG: hypothetical protein DI586_00355 [Micavibrio aeruginosavorus]|uniref:Uncharacterized protein n=1 Tax=Micavibrio aeruginosavorus TaxID=349221 RepID=A0A2W5HPM0_9BACT|nr:MAG: hypothetical protein DI586_00355 [Micavibrio aeruginosavorus]